MATASRTVLVSLLVWLLGSTVASALAWSPRIDPARPLAPYDETAVSCFASSQCVVAGGSMDLGGGPTRVFGSGDAAGGLAGWEALLDAPGDGGSFDALACPAASLCVAGRSTQGDSAPQPTASSVWRTGDPFGGLWQRTASATGVAGVSCASVSFCAAVLDTGRTLTSTDPAAPLAGWRQGPVSGLDPELAVSCPTVSFCAGVDSVGAVRWSTAPAGTARWMGFTTRRTSEWDAISCPSANLCVAGGADDRATPVDALLASSDPTDRRSWVQTTLRGATESPSEQATDGGVNGVSCPSVSLCVAVDEHGRVLVSTDPAARPAAWRRVARFGFQLNAVSCTAALVCVAAGDDAHIVWSADPARAWAAGRLDDGYAPLTGALCLTRLTCVAIDTHGNFLRAAAGRDWTRPASRTVPIPGSPGWRTPAFSGAFACASRSLCLAGGPRRIWWARRPDGGPSAWHRVRLSVGRHWAGWAVNVSGLACPSTRLCTAVDDLGDVLVSTSPKGRGHGWRLMRRAPGGCAADSEGPDPCGLNQVSCPTVHLCVATGNPNGILAATAPRRRRSWHIIRIRLGQVQCPRASLCLGIPATTTQLAKIRQGPGAGGVVGSYRPRIAVSTHPTRGDHAWPSYPLSGFRTLSSLSCVGARLCAVAGTGSDGDGAVAVSTTPTRPGSWLATTVSDQPLNGVRCFRGPICVAWDDQGAWAVGR